MSEKSEKLVKIILPDLLNYLEMVESGEIIERRVKRQFLGNQEEKAEKQENSINEKLPKDIKLL